MQIKPFTQSLNNFNAEQFLKEYWQKKPLLLRSAIAPESLSLTPEELAGLACEEEIESRIVTFADNDWSLQQGPFTEQFFNQQPEQDWTLLVQAVDHYIPEVAQLLNYFRFIPNWRIDDIMVSYATTGASVGPHYDNYDVFLIQGAGTRNWKVGPPVNSNVVLRDNKQLRLLTDFECNFDWKLEPGDILYLPPRYAHWGIATSNDCMTYSVGFRAPSIAELLSDLCDETLSNMDYEERYGDAHLSLQENPGEINTETIDKISHLMTDKLLDKSALAIWLGQFLTQPKYDLLSEENGCFSRQEIIEQLKNNHEICRDSASRFAFTSTDNSTTLFINGHDYPCYGDAIALAKLLCNHDSFYAKTLYEYTTDENCLNLLVTLFNQGCLYVDDEYLD